MCKQKLTAGIIALFCFSTMIEAQTVFYVSKSGSDNNNGSASAPFATMETAVQKVSENVETVIYVQEDATFNISKLDLLNNKKVSIIGRNTVFLADDEPGKNGQRILRAGTDCDLKVKGIIFKNARQVDYFPGGAVFFLGNTLEIDSCKFYDNEAGSGGGAIASRGKTVIVRNSYFEGNHTLGGGSQGGAILQSGKNDATTGCSLTVENSTFYKNVLDLGDQGTAIGLRDGSKGLASPYSNVDYVVVVNCIFLENTTTTPYQAAVDVSGGDTETYLINNTFYKNAGALRIGIAFNPVGLINNVIFAEKAGIFGSLSVADGREPVIAYNNIIVGGERGVNEFMDDEALDAQKEANNNIVTTLNLYPWSNVALASALSTDNFVPYLPITSESSTLINAGLNNSTDAIGQNLIPSADVRGKAIDDVKDIGAYEWGVKSGIIHSARIDAFDVVQTKDYIWIKNRSGNKAQLTVFDVAGRIVYSGTVSQSESIDKNKLTKGVNIFILSNENNTVAKKALIY
ncbi:MAG: T9SS type A sorting domain-containing protein [Dysgonamonadaceae bacterium]|jgi:hypothetical protein|nr:T9SS type A sorting domain-containing protein [Dysgonamonadaceae bacterium]